MLVLEPQSFDGCGGVFVGIEARVDGAVLVWGVGLFPLFGCHGLAISLPSVSLHTAYRTALGCLQSSWGDTRLLRRYDLDKYIHKKVFDLKR